ncbi:SPOR domain-containing protein [Pseudaminobacter sp. 19-2017]|uniref:SPOR domain-containing protein n=1 Tax=Pseudaminobacter soli (ex Zhang et al. 2022) TaxID=2831468 RepID=A0A942DXY8_9HYPH|nr:SPOR domain-containing protein [Pseudaminobacter soli]MBS3647483.1 SPOR domain-containing protein [Pseudaminobacter soli]
MAEQASRKIADQSAISDDDPFAELTRIMGFDPREPAKPAAVKEVKPAVQSDPDPAHFEQSDLSLDLERELLGDLADDTFHASEQVDWQFSAAPEALSHEAQSIEQPAAAEMELADQYQPDETAGDLSAQSAELTLDYPHEGFPEEGNTATAEAYTSSVDKEIGIDETFQHDGFPDQASAAPEEGAWAQSELAPHFAQADPSLDFAFDEQLDVVAEGESEGEQIAEDRAWSEAADPELPLAEAQTEYAAEETAWAQPEAAPLAAQPETSIEIESDFAAAFDEQLSALVEAEPEIEQVAEGRAWSEVGDAESPLAQAQTEYAAEETAWAQPEAAPLAAQPETSIEIESDFAAAFDEQLSALVEAEPEIEQVAEGCAWSEVGDAESPLAEAQTEYAAEETAWAQPEPAPLAVQPETSIESDFAAAFDEQLSVSVEAEPEVEQVAGDHAWPEAADAESPLAEAPTEYAAEETAWAQPEVAPLAAQPEASIESDFAAAFEEQLNVFVEAEFEVEQVAEDSSWSEAAQEVPQGEARTEYAAENQTGEQWNEDSDIGRSLTEAADLQAPQGEAQTEHAAEYQAPEQWNQEGVTDRTWPEAADLDAHQVEFQAAAEAGYQIGEEWSQEVTPDHVSLEAGELELPQGEIAAAYDVAYQAGEQHQDWIGEQPQPWAGQDAIQEEEAAGVGEASEIAGAVIDDTDHSEPHVVAAPEWHQAPVAWEETSASFEQAAHEEGGASNEAYPAAVIQPLVEHWPETAEVHAGNASAPIDQPSPAEALELSLEQELNALLGNDLAAEDQPQAPEEPSFEESAAEIAPQSDVEDDWVRVPLRGSLAGDNEWRAAEASDNHRASAAYSEEDRQAAQYHHDIPGPHAFEEAPEPDLEFAFDDHAFEAALTSAAADGSVDERQSTPVAEQAEEPTHRDDPYAALAALSASLQNPHFNSPAHARGEPQYPEHAPSFASSLARPAIREDVPEIETIDVPEQAVALADDLELPEIAFEPEPVPAAPFDDLDAEFSSLLEDMNVRGAEIASAAPQADASREIRLKGQAEADPYGDDAASAAGAAMTAAALAAGAAQPQGYDVGYASKPDAATYLRQQSANQTEPNDVEFAFDPDQEEDFSEPAYAPVGERSSRRRGMIIAAVVGGVAMLGGIGALAMSFGSGPGGDEVALVKADPSPVKVKPENPGGVSIPNQDSKVYDTVAGAGTAAEPTQEKLISSAEEPVEIPMPQDDPFDLPGVDNADLESAQAMLADEAGSDAAAAPSAKSEDRVEQAAGAGVDETMEVAAVAPRKVRTMIVKADGTLVPREEPAPAADQAADSASESIVDPAATAPLSASGDAAALPAEAQSGMTAAPAGAASLPETAAADQTAAAQPAEAMPQAQGTIGITPDRAPIAPARPSDQPIDIVGEVKPQQVAGLAPAAAGGSWSMQIASQPTEAAAQSSYQDLLRRYGGVLEGKQANIVKAEIAGKGTFWRVRVPAESRNDAVKLCESYKAAGGNCFVTR